MLKNGNAFFELILKIQLRTADKSAALKEILLPLKKFSYIKRERN